MRYIKVATPGDPSVMTIAEGPTPTPKSGEVLIKVAAAGVNRPDVAQRRGLYPPPADASPILGLEVAGEIVALGDGVPATWLHTRVCALTNGGGYAEYAVAPVGQCLPIPNGLSFIEAAALPETFFTVWSNVFDRAGLKAGETLLVHGGASGIGTTAIMLGKLMGAIVYVTVGSDDKCAFCEKLGAAKAINYNHTDFVQALQALTQNKGVDVILDMVGGDYIAKNIQLAARDGRIVSIAFLKGPSAEVNFAPVMMKRLTLTGSTLRPRTAAEKAAIATALHAKVWPALEQGTVKPVIAACFPLEKVVDAHELMESNQHMGKIILQVAQ